MSARIIRGNALALPLADDSVDLVVTSPPYFGLRSYQDGGEHYAGQIGSEATPAEFVDALLAATREMVRVVKPSGSIWVNLGDKYVADNRGSGGDVKRGEAKWAPAGPAGYPGEGIIARKSLMGLPWRYALRCIDDLGLILRAEVIWSKPNGLPESVTDRVRRSHETWFHFVLQPRYFSAVDEIREAHNPASQAHHERYKTASRTSHVNQYADVRHDSQPGYKDAHPLGKLPGSVWTDQRVPDGTNLIRSILEAVAAGAITTDEGERLWTGQSISWGTSTSPKTDAGNGPATESLLATERSPSSASAARTSPTASAIDCSSAPFQTGSPSTTSAATPDASGPITSSQSPSERTSGEPTPNAQSASTGTLSPTPTLTSPRQASGTRSAGHASSPASDVGESVWQVPTQPLKVPPELGIDHFAAFPLEFPRRIIQGWSPAGVCTACGEGRRPVRESEKVTSRPGFSVRDQRMPGRHASGNQGREGRAGDFLVSISGYACACPDTTAPTTPAVILDPFGGTGTTALVAKALGRTGISVDMSADYCRLAQWRTTDPGELARAMQVEKPAKQIEGQISMLDLLDEEGPAA